MIGSEDERVNQDVGTPREGQRSEATLRPWYPVPEYPRAFAVSDTGRLVYIVPGEPNHALALEAVNAYDRLRRIEAAALALVDQEALDTFSDAADRALETLREALDLASLRDKETAK